MFGSWEGKSVLDMDKDTTTVAERKVFGRQTMLRNHELTVNNGPLEDRVLPTATQENCVHRKWRPVSESHWKTQIGGDECSGFDCEKSKKQNNQVHKTINEDRDQGT